MPSLLLLIVKFLDRLSRKSENLEGRGDITLWNPIGDFSRLPELAQYIVTVNVDSHSQNE